MEEIDWSREQASELCEESLGVSPADDCVQIQPTYPETVTRRSDIGTAAAGEIIQLSQLLSSITDPTELVEAFMGIVLERGRSDRAVLIVDGGGGLSLATEAASIANTAAVTVKKIHLADSALPLSIVRHVQKTDRYVVVQDSDVCVFRGDVYLRHAKRRSLLCLPVLKQGERLGVMYLENSMVLSAFDEAVIESLKILTAQLGISIANARLYSSLKSGQLESRRTEERLKRSEALLAEGQRIGNTGTWMWDPKSGEMLWTEQLYKILGIATTKGPPSIEELMRRVVPDDRERLRDAATATLVGDDVHEIEFSIVEIEGDLRRLLLTCRPWVGHGERRGWYIGTISDITDRRAAKDTVRRSEVSLSEAQRLGNIGSIGWKVGSEVIDCSALTLRILGMSFPVVISHLLKIVHPDDVEQLKYMLNDASNDVSDFKTEFRVFERGGSTKYLKMAARRIESVEGVEYVGALVDVTDMRVAQSALMKAQAELTHVTRVSTLGELTSTIAHDLKQPLMAIQMSGGAGLAWLDRPEPRLDQVRASFLAVVKSAGVANNVIDRLRALVRKEPSRRVPIDMAHTVAELTLLVGRELDRNSIRLNVSAEEGLPRVTADKVQIQQVVMNLIVNAMHAITRSKNSKKEITIVTKLVADRCVRVSVIDSGTGIPDDVADRLFEPFFTTRSEGIGLGLSISRSIIDQHFGVIRAGNNDTQGATVYFELNSAA
ncbi:sensor histidine kinase [Paraburkholderia sp. BCC1884]|uniref:sensor histidine kinase n=1 Tax=Paraburkholderia sp. BCC1884 TaxID=2562668 RepID=UPI001181F5A1|nr:sensor histidine kinase [Paraburkholderia sp. BCC1884]